MLRLNPAPSDALRIAARGQHIGRWTSPRESFPMDRGGYLRWREELKRFHAKTVADIMAKESYSETEIEAVRQIILKKYQTNADAQTIEDALCLVFLESQFEELRRKTPDPKDDRDHSESMEEDESERQRRRAHNGSSHPPQTTYSGRVELGLYGDFRRGLSRAKPAVHIDGSHEGHGDRRKKPDEETNHAKQVNSRHAPG